MKYSFKKSIACVLGGAVLLGVLPSWAHHSTTMFEHDKLITISGVVTEVMWTNPHVAIVVEGAQSTEKPAVWLLEMTSPGNLTRGGLWSRKSFKAGDKVTVELSPLRDGRKGGALRKITNNQTKLSLNANLREQEGVLDK